MATLIPAESSQPNKEVQPRNGKNFALAELQEYVGGMIEILDLPDGRIMVCNEESKLARDPVKNRRAMEFLVFETAGEVRKQIAEAQANGDFVMFVGDLPKDDNEPADYIAGTVLVCNSSEVA